MILRAYRHKLIFLLYLIFSITFLSGCGMERSAESNSAAIIVGSPNIQSKSGFARAVDANDDQLPNEITEIIFRLTDSQNNLITEFDALAAQTDNKINVLAGEHYELHGTAKAGEETIYSGLASISALVPNEARAVSVFLNAQFDIKLSVEDEVTPITKPTIAIGSPNPTQLALDIQGLQNQNVMWYVNDELGGSESLGFVDEEGKYTPPLALPKDENGETIEVQIKAIPEVAPSFSARLDIELIKDSNIIIDTVPPTVTISLPGGFYNTTQTVEINCDDCIAIHFTTDGSEPELSSAIANGSISISQNTVLKYFAVDAAYNRNATQTETYIIDLPPTTQAIPGSGLYNSAQTVELRCDECETIYYTLDNSIPTSSSAVYNSTLTIDANTTIRYFAVDALGNQETSKSSRYTFDLEAPVSFATPASGSYSSAQNITLSCSESNCTIYYTTDGATPTISSTIYSGPINISSNTTLKYIAVDIAGNIQLSANTENYQINILVPPSNLNSTIIDGAVDLTWDAVPGADSYTVYRSSVPNLQANGIEIATVTTNSFLDLDVVDQSAVYYAVKSNNIAVSTGLSAEHEVVFEPLISSLIFDDANLAICVNSGPEVYVSELLGLSCSDMGISSLNGIEALTAVTQIALDGNNITDISPLAGLIGLTDLYLGFNSISDLSALTELNALIILELPNNAISDLSPLGNLTTLTRLDLEVNEIVDISALANLVNLHELNLSSNTVSDISALVNLTLMNRLGFYGNNLSDISALSGMTMMNHLYLGGNVNISDVTPLSNMIQLNYLHLGINNLTDISPLAMLTNLTELYLHDNFITNVTPISELRQLNILQLHTNNISIGVSGLNNLTSPSEIRLADNPNIPCGEVEALDNIFDSGDGALAGIITWTTCDNTPASESVFVTTISGVQTSLDGTYSTECRTTEDGLFSGRESFVISGDNMDYLIVYYNSPDCTTGGSVNSVSATLASTGLDSSITGWIDYLGNISTPPIASDGSGSLTNTETFTGLTLTVYSAAAPDLSLTIGLPVSVFFIVDDTGPNLVLYYDEYYEVGVLNAISDIPVIRQ